MTGPDHKITKPLRNLIYSAGLCVVAALGTLPLRIPAAQPGPQPKGDLHRWGAITLFHGLPSNHVRAIAQDTDGTILLGTDAGLARYDGRRVQKLASAGVLASAVHAIEIDQSGTAWIGTDGGATRLIDGEAEQITQTAGDSVRAIATLDQRVFLVSAGGSIYDCLSDAEGKLSVGAISQKDSPLLSIDRGSGGRSSLELTSAIVIDDRLVIGTRSRGLLNVQIGSTLGQPFEVNSRPRPFFVEALSRGSDGRVWIGTSNPRDEIGLFSATDLLRPVQSEARTGTVNELRFDRSGNLWVGTDGRGVFRFHRGELKEHFTFENTDGGLRSNRINAIFPDREGVVWFGTDRGVCRYDPGGLGVELVSPDAGANVIRALYQAADGRWWCGTKRGLFFSDRSGEWRAVREMKNRTVHSIGEDQSGRLLIGTAGGLFGLEVKRPGKGEFKRLADDPDWNARAICFFKGSVFVGSFGRGVESLDGDNRAVVWSGASAGSRGAVSLHVDQNRLLIGTIDRGVLAYDGGKVGPLEGLGDLDDATVWSIAGSSDRVLWLATSRGLYAFTAGRLDAVIRDCDARRVVESTSTPGVAWCATAGRGVFKVLLSADGVRVIAKLDAEHGLPSQDVFDVVQGRFEHATFMIGTSRGLGRLQSRPELPLLNVSRATAERTYSEKEVLAGLALDYPRNGLTVELSASSSRTYPEQFQYVLRTTDDRGTQAISGPSRDPLVTFSGLKPGKYRVEARVYNADLVESLPLVFEVTIAGAPFPWTSTALGVLLTLALFALAWGWRQNRRIGSANTELAETRFQLANETETERRRIARDLHDQTLADLRRLMMMTDHLPGASGNGQTTVDAGAFRQEVDSISTEIRRICEDLSPSALANVGLAAALEWVLADAAGQLPLEKRFEYRLIGDERIDEKLNLAPAEQIQIYRIVQEALSNVCRHSGASLVQLKFYVEDAAMVIELEDNGRGFEPVGSSGMGVSGRGLSNIRSRASLVQASVSWGVRPGGGIIFVLRKTL